METANTINDINISKSIAQSLPYKILRTNIFKYLNGMDLWSASMVCSSWLKAANDEKRERARGPVCITEKDLPYGLKRIGVIREIVKKLGIRPLVSISIGYSLSPYMEKNDCVIFVTLNLRDELGSSNDNNHDSDRNFLASFLGLDDDEYATSRANVAAVCAFLPSIPEINIKVFCVTLFSWDHREFPKAIGDELKKPSIQDKESKCLLLFARNSEVDSIKDFVLSFGTCYPGKTCLWGGSVCAIQIPKRKNSDGEIMAEPVRCMAIIITGTFECWSMIMDKTHKTCQRIETKLMELKNKVHLRRHSMGFMFAIPKDNLVEDENVKKVQIFKKIFPGIPLLDCVGLFVFGNDTITNPLEHPPKKKKYNPRAATAFMIITYD